MLLFLSLTFKTPTKNILTKFTELSLTKGSGWFCKNFLGATMISSVNFLSTFLKSISWDSPFKVLPVAGDNCAVVDRLVPGHLERGGGLHHSLWLARLIRRSRTWPYKKFMYMSSQGWLLAIYGNMIYTAQRRRASANGEGLYYVNDC